MLNRTRKNPDSYCDITIREKGPDAWPLLIIEVEFKDNSDRFFEMITKIKTSVPKGCYFFDRANLPHVWRVSERYQIFIERAAVELGFDSVSRIEGERITNLKTGTSSEQLTLL